MRLQPPLTILVAFSVALVAAPALAAPRVCASSARDAALVDRFYNEVFMARNVSLAPKYLSVRYIQHNPHVAPALAGFMKDFGEGWSQPPPPSYKRVLLKTVADCDHNVVLYVRQTWVDKEGKARSHLSFDMFHIVDGMIDEHWDADD